jgi:predicted transcriptional regulator
MRGLGELEAVIMDVLWRWDRPATVRDVLEHLRTGRTIAYTTVMTVMDNLHRKGWLQRERDGRAYRYEPVASREQYSAELMREALGDSDDRTATLVHFVAHMDPAESAALRAALARLEVEAPP